MLEKKLSKGLVHIYTGEGKGKTTAALGQGFRTAGGGYRVLLAQFLKGQDTGELHSIAQLPNFDLLRFGKPKKFYFQMNEEEKAQVKEAIEEGLKAIEEAMAQEAYNLIILDEILGTIKNGIVTEEQVLALIDQKPAHMELILTGRDAPQALVERANYVTEMKMIKHPYQEGIHARKGIES